MYVAIVPKAKILQQNEHPKTCDLKLLFIPIGIEQTEAVEREGRVLFSWCDLCHCWEKFTSLYFYSYFHLIWILSSLLKQDSLSLFPLSLIWRDFSSLNVVEKLQSHDILNTDDTHLIFNFLPDKFLTHLMGKNNWKMMGKTDFIAILFSYR